MPHHEEITIDTLERLAAAGNWARLLKVAGNEQYHYDTRSGAVEQLLFAVDTDAAAHVIDRLRALDGDVRAIESSTYSLSLDAVIAAWRLVEGHSSDPHALTQILREGQGEDPVLPCSRESPTC